MTQSQQRYIVGLDGGGTGCRAVVSDHAGTIIGRGNGPAANIATNFQGTLESILIATRTAYATANLPIEQMENDVAVLGLAGSRVGDLSGRLEKTLPFFRSKVVNDRDTTVQGALEDADGSVAVIGTGSFFVGRHGENTVSIGGWGFHLADDGSGARMGQELLRRTVLAYDGLAPHSDLSRAILVEFGGSPDGIVEFALQADPRDYGEFAPRIIEGVRAGDIIAHEIFESAKACVQHALDTIGVGNGGSLCLLGGLGPIYQEFLDSAYQAYCVPPKGNALDGAIELARREFASQLGDEV